MLDAPSTSSEYIDGHDDNEGCRDMSFVEVGKIASHNAILNSCVYSLNKICVNLC